MGVAEGVVGRGSGRHANVGPRVDRPADAPVACEFAVSPRIDPTWLCHSLRRRGVPAGGCILGLDPLAIATSVASVPAWALDFGRTTYTPTPKPLVAHCPSPDRVLRLPHGSQAGLPSTRRRRCLGGNAVAASRTIAP